MTSLKPRSTTHLEPDPLRAISALEKVPGEGSSQSRIWRCGGEALPRSAGFNAFTYPSGRVPAGSGLAYSARENDP